MIRLALLLLVVGWPAAARSDTTANVNIELNQAGRDFATDLGLDLPELEHLIEGGVKDMLGLAGGFLRSFANATSFSNRGLGVDYASNSERAIVGLAANAAVAFDLDSNTPAAGAAANLAFMAGLNLRRWNHPELTVFTNLFWRSASTDHFHGALVSAGAHAQYKLFTPTRGLKRLAVQWGGFDITSGLELARWSYGLDGELSRSFNLGTEMASTITASTGGRFDLAATTVTLPIEVTTNVRLLYLASLYTGIGLDVQLGRSTVDVGVQGALVGTRVDTGEQETIGAVTVAGTGSQGPSVLGYHLLLGVQANFWRLKLFAQATVEPFDAVALSFGTRIVL